MSEGGGEGENGGQFNIEHKRCVVLYFCPCFPIWAHMQQKKVLFEVLGRMLTHDRKFY